MGKIKSIIDHNALQTGFENAMKLIWKGRCS